MISRLLAGVGVTRRYHSGDGRRHRIALQALVTFHDRQRFSGDDTVAERAKAELFEIRNLSVGKKAPDIEGEDQDGRRFKLSDYRGKVVLLDFWSYV